MKKEEVKKGIYPIEDGSHYGEVLYGYTDMEEAKKDYEEETGEKLDVENCQEMNVEAVDNGKGFGFSCENQDKGVPSIVNIY